MFDTLEEAMEYNGRNVTGATLNQRFDDLAFHHGHQLAFYRSEMPDGTQSIGIECEDCDEDLVTIERER